MKSWMISTALLLSNAWAAMAAEGDPVWLPRYEKGQEAAAATSKPIFLVFR